MIDIVMPAVVHVVDEATDQMNTEASDLRFIRWIQPARYLFKTIKFIVDNQFLANGAPVMCATDSQTFITMDKDR